MFSQVSIKEIAVKHPLPGGGIARAEHSMHGVRGTWGGGEGREAETSGGGFDLTVDPATSGCLLHRDWLLLALCTSEIKGLGLHPSACTFTEQVPAFLTGFPLHEHQLYWIDVSETVGVCTYTNDK